MKLTTFALTAFFAILLNAVTGFALEINKSGPDAASLGESEGYPVCPHSQTFRKPECRVGTWSAQEKVRLTRGVMAADNPQVLPAMEAPPVISYRWGFSQRTIDDHLSSVRVTGLLIIKDGKVVAERYQYGRNPSMRLISFSMAKTITGVLVGIAHARGYIESLDDPVAKYWPEVAQSAYGQTTIKNLLRMASGVPFRELYTFTADDDLTQWGLVNNLHENRDNPQKVIDFINARTHREVSQGERFRYASIESDILGRVLIKATGKSVSDLTQEWVWKPMGAEAAARWALSSTDRAERTQGDFNATLRDYGRFGMLLANDGTRDNVQIIPKEFLLDGTDPQRQPAAFRPGRAASYYGYGYQMWLMPFKHRTFAARGIYGQYIFVQPAAKIVMVQTSVFDKPGEGWDRTPHQQTLALWKAVLQSLGGSTEDQ